IKQTLNKITNPLQKQTSHGTFQLKYINTGSGSESHPNRELQISVRQTFNNKSDNSYHLFL
ncbi:TPA: hypothetical protein ACIO8W_004371, partial [Salmonella enterica subsp. enterica serovar Reading]